ncbi:hypothetical protein Tco_0272748 [Tanacetum coccineum]
MKGKRCCEASLSIEGVLVTSVFELSMERRLFHNPNVLWVHVVKAIHGDEVSTDIRGCHTNGVWASIVGLIFHLHSSGIVPLNSIRFKIISPGKKTKISLFNNTLQMVLGFGIGVDRLMWKEQKMNSTPFSDIASLEPEELVDSNTCICSLSHDDKFLVNSVRKHIDELSLPSLSPSTRWCKIIPRN